MSHTWVIGTDDTCEIRVNAPVVSRRHCRLSLDENGWVIEDLGSTNGTFVSGERLTAPRRIGPNDSVTLGTSLPLPWPKEALPAQCHSLPSIPLPSTGTRIILGRAPTCDVVIDEPMVSSRHASIEAFEAAWLVRDLGSTNGTFVHGLRIRRPTVVGVGAEIGFGSHRVSLVAPGEPASSSGHENGATIEVHNLAVEAAGRRLIERVSLVVRPGELVGVMGPSGAGKSTLLAAISGGLRPVDGRVIIDGIDLYERFDELRGHIGYVPQDDIMHGELTIRQALWYTGRLRLPRDYSRSEIHARVTSVLKQLGLQDVADARIGSVDRRGISGGQRKRVNVALELMTDPPVLLLDEPTSGLSSTDAIALLQLLRELANRGKTVILTIHQPALPALQLLDALAVIARDRSTADVGRLAWFGPPVPDAIAFFEPENRRLDADAVLRGLAGSPVARWCDAYDNTAAKRTWIDRRLSATRTTSAPRPQQRLSLFDTMTQWRVLVTRMAAIKLADGWTTAVLFLQAPVIAGLIVLVFGAKTRAAVTHESWTNVSQAVATTTFLIALAAIWFGCANAIREIVSERAIFRRERMAGMSVNAYLASKVTVLFLICALQCGMLQAVVTPGCSLVAEPAHIWTVLVLASTTAVMIGLGISATVRTAEAAGGVLPLILLPMVILGGILLPLQDMPGPTSVLADTAPSRWAFEALLVPESDARPKIELPDTVQAGKVAVTNVLDMAEPWFPVDGARCSPTTPLWMLLTATLVCLAALRTVMVRQEVGST